MHLSEIDPERLALGVGEALLQHLQRLALPVSPGVHLQVDGGIAPPGEDGARTLKRLPADPRAVGLALTAADLCRYAQRGELGDWGDDSGALDAAQALVEGLYGRPADHLPAGDPEPETMPWWAGITADTALGTVLQAALARAWARTWASSVPLSWLAALAGVSPGRLRQLAAEGEIQTTGGSRGGPGGSAPAMVAPEEARRWLSSREIPGW